MQLRKKVKIRAMAHITGGGLTENIPRTLPPFVAARIYRDRWPKPKIMQWLQDEGEISDTEMYRTFNCGIGMVLSVAAEHAQECVQICASLGQQAWHIGDIISTDTAAPQLFIK
jgi:phosphoribosylformylglycinamidine cyclo-ligase